MLRHPARSLITSRSPAPTASHPTLSLASVGIDGAVVPRRRFVNLILRRRVHRRVLMRRRRWHRRSVRIVKIFLPHPRRLQSTRSRLCRQRRRRHQERLRATRRLRHRRRPHRRHSGHRARRRGLHPLFNLSPRLRPILHRRSRQHPRRFRRRALHADDARQPLPDGDHLPLHQHILPHRQRRSIHHLPPHLQQHHRHPRRLHDDALDHLPSSAALELFARVTRPSPLPPPRARLRRVRRAHRLHRTHRTRRRVVRHRVRRRHRARPSRERVCHRPSRRVRALPRARAHRIARPFRLVRPSHVLRRRRPERVEHHARASPARRRAITPPHPIHARIASTRACARASSRHRGDRLNRSVLCNCITMYFYIFE